VQSGWGPGGAGMRLGCCRGAAGVLPGLGRGRPGGDQDAAWGQDMDAENREDGEGLVAGKTGNSWDMYIVRAGTKKEMGKGLQQAGSRVAFVRNFPCQTLKIRNVSLVVMGS
jgi:hypothetical protein